MGGKRLRKLRWGSKVHTTFRQDKEFTDYVKEWVLNDENIPLDEVIDWIAERYTPGDVFSLGVLDRWAAEHNYTL